MSEPEKSTSYSTYTNACRISTILWSSDDDIISGRSNRNQPYHGAHVIINTWPKKHHNSSSFRLRRFYCTTSTILVAQSKFRPKSTTILSGKIPNLIWVRLQLLFLSQFNWRKFYGFSGFLLSTTLFPNGLQREMTAEWTKSWRKPKKKDLETTRTEGNKRQLFKRSGTLQQLQRCWPWHTNTKAHHHNHSGNAENQESGGTRMKWTNFKQGQSQKQPANKTSTQQMGGTLLQLSSKCSSHGIHLPHVLNQNRTQTGS